MLSLVANRTYLKLFSAQVVALLGTGIATVALGLLAFELAGPDAGAVLGTALAIKMIAYVGVAPIASAVVDRFPRRAFLIGLDLFRAAIAGALPFVDQIWQIYVLIFLLQSASAAFTPSFQATIPEVVPDEREYTKALSLSRIAYDLESLASPAIAAALLSFMGFHWLFSATAFGFIASAALVAMTVLPHVPSGKHGPAFTKITRGLRIYLATPRLRGLLALNAAAAAGGAMVIVNTVVLVESTFGHVAADVAIAYAAFGAGSMASALLLPKLLKNSPDRTVMVFGAVGLAIGLALDGAGIQSQLITWEAFLVIWLLLGFSYSTVLTPSGRLLRRSSHQPDRPAVFAAQFALSHACWLLTYPLAGWLGAYTTLPVVSYILAVFAIAALLVALSAWPKSDPEVVLHVHDDLPSGHPHLNDAMSTGHGWNHAHTYVIDDQHKRWPVQI